MPKLVEYEGIFMCPYCKENLTYVIGSISGSQTIYLKGNKIRDYGDVDYPSDIDYITCPRCGEEITRYIG